MNKEEKFEECNECNCISEILNKIIHLQRKEERTLVIIEELP